MSRLILFENEHLLVVNKPPGWNTHAPSALAGQGIYEWLKDREVRWRELAIIHRLDKETSGVLVLSKTRLANKSLTEQFTNGEVRKEYVLRVARLPRERKFVVNSKLNRTGEKYASGKGGVEAVTEFEVLDAEKRLILARPRTGRTHQIRVHASENGFPILGDTLYGGAKFERVCLHARRIEFLHPASGGTFEASAEVDFDLPLWQARRNFVGGETNAFRWVQGASDGFAGWHLDQLGAFLLSQSAGELSGEQVKLVKRWFPGCGLYHKVTTAHVRGKQKEESSPRHVFGPKAEGAFVVLENGVKFEMSFEEGYSTGLFLDQRENRRRMLCEARGEVLNAFAYTCGFSVCAALAGARTTSLDLSRKYLDWGRRNFRINGLDDSKHDFIFGDVFDWMRRLGKKGRKFDWIVLDPPTFSQSKESGMFRVERDFGRLMELALPLLNSGGTILASSNSARWEAEDFLGQIRVAIGKGKRQVLAEDYRAQPPDFPISKGEPAYLKTVWLRVD